jgi:membrane protease subunit HflC
VYRFDNRIHCLDGSFEQALTQDGKSVIVSVYAGWKIRDPMVFLERVGSITEAEQNLNGLLSNYKNAVVGQYLFSQLINTDTNILRFDQIEAEMLNAVRPVSAQRYGIDTLFVGIRRLSLPSAITEKVFQRMRAEREETAEKYRAEGEGEAIRIRAEADSDRDRILAAAEAQAKRIRAEGDAQAAEFYKTFEKNPDLAMFLRKLEVFEKTLQKRATVVLGPDTEPYDLLRGSEALPLKK